MKKKILFGTVQLAIYLCAFSQTKATTDDGRKVILYENGTYIYTGQNSKDCEQMKYGTILIINNRNEGVRLEISGVTKLVNNPNYGQPGVVEERIWRTKLEDVTVPAGEMIKIIKVKAGAYSYEARTVYNTSSYGGGDVEVIPCKEQTIEIN